MLIKAGSAEVGGLIEMVEWDEPNDLAWSSVTGIDQRGRFRLRPAGNGSTRVELRYQYGVAGGGLTGWLSERVSAPSISKDLRTLAPAAQAPGRAGAPAARRRCGRSAERAEA